MWKKMSLKQHAFFEGIGEIWRVKKYPFCCMKPERQIKELNMQNVRETFELKVRKNSNGKEATPVKSFRPLSHSCKFPHNSQRHVLFSYVGV